jgi:phage tail-like protein
MTISAIGALAQSLAPGQAAHKVDPALALGFRFSVEIDDLDLGHWQACSGLSVDFQPVEVRSGGDYLGSRYLAGEAKYGRVILRRAASLEASAKVQSWLMKHARKWLDGKPPEEGPKPGKPPPANKSSAADGAVGVIRLYDSNDTEVMNWVLSGVRPAAWKGPDLDASASKVALETLELVHEGFSVGKGSASQEPERPSRSVLTLTGTEDTGKQVVFPFAPVKVTVTRSHDGAAFLQDRSTVDGQTATGEETGVATSLQLGGRANATAYSFANLTLVGDKVQTDVRTLLDWSTKSVTGTSPEPKLPLVDFTFGSGLSGKGFNLTSLTVQFTRFTAEGKPSRAMVTSLKLEEPRPDRARRGSRNPTSGGIAGRARHVLHEPESLPRLAQQTYGDASAWRDIADANGIDDPLRVRPGTPVLLPARTEMGHR